MEASGRLRGGERGMDYDDDDVDETSDVRTAPLWVEIVSNRNIQFIDIQGFRIEMSAKEP